MSKSDKKPIENVGVSPIGEDTDPVFTDIDGHFTIEVKKDSGTLELVTPLLSTFYFDYKGSKHLDIFIDNNVNLQEVVAIGYGNVNQSNLTTSVGVVDNVESVSERPVTNISEFLQGKVAGVNISQNGGDPTSLPSIIVRGMGSLNNEGTLYIVDNAIYNGPPINPNDIKSVSILKDAAAMAIYGSQAAGGVVIIETKKGQKGKPIININTLTSFQQATNLPTPLNAAQQSEIYRTAAANDGIEAPSAHDPSKNKWGQITRTNWLDEIFRTGKLYKVNASVSGATDNVNYFTSLEYLDKEGILLGTNFKRYGVRAKGEFNITDNLKVGTNLYYSKSNQAGTNTESGYSGTILNAMWMPSAAPVYDDKGNFHGTVPKELESFGGAYGEVYNPVAQLLRPTVSNPLTYFNGSAFLEYQILKGLTASTRINYHNSDRHFKKFTPRIPEIGRQDSQNYLNEEFENKNGWLWDNQLSYDKNFGLHNLNLTFIQSAYEDNFEFFSQEGRKFAGETPNYQFMAQAGELHGTPIGIKEKVRNASLIGRIMYDYLGKYFLSASYRRDETSKANPENDDQVNYSPSVSAAWRISKEDFFNVDFINNLKIRSSWGKIANVNPLNAYPFDISLGGGSVVLGENGTYDYYGVYSVERVNKHVTWEKTKSFDLGIDIELLNKALSFTADYYDKRTEDLILKEAPNPLFGVNPTNINGGEVKNSGYEFTAKYNNNNNPVKFSIGANLSTNKNEVVSFKDAEGNPISSFFINENIRGTLHPYQDKGNVIGDELYSFYLIPQIGIFQNQSEIDNYKDSNGNLIQPKAKPGDFKFADTNGDGKITAEDRVNSGSYMPNFTYGFNINAEFKNFELSMLFQGVAVVKIFNALKYETYNPALQGFNLDSRALNAWSPNNTNTNIPRLTTKDNNQNYSTTSDWYLENGSYFRLKNLTLGYNFNTLSNKLNHAKIFISADNLFTITDYTGIDPEVGYNGLDNGRYPLSKVYSIGLNLQF